ncbi:MAG TPA: glycosyltransferase [bacterium]|nr:glycosyltransferase [bacterium]
MRILHVDPAPTWRGGERQVFLLARELARRGHECSVAAARNSPLAAECSRAGLRVHPLAMRGDLDVVAIGRLAHLLRRDPPDILHLHTARAHGVGGFAARATGFHPVLVTRRVELPVRGPFSRWKYRALADHYIAISAVVARSLERAGIPSDRIARIPSGIEIPPLVPRVAAAPNARRTVGTLAAFTPQKDPSTWISAAIRVCRKHPDVDFLWWGEGPFRQTLQEIALRENLRTQIQLPGFQQDLTEFWRRIDVFFLPSRFEALGTSLLDALARAIPVVASNVGGIPEVVRAEQEGILVEPRNAEQFANALNALLEDPDRARALGAAGRTRALEFEIGPLAARVEALYAQLISAPRSTGREALTR